MKVHGWRYAAGMLAAALVLTGCGSDADPEEADSETEATTATEAATQTDDDTETETEAEEPAEDLEPIRALFATRYAVPSLGDIAEPLGFWEDRGLEVELLEGQEAVETLASGDMDVAVSSPNRFIGGILAGAEIEILGPTGLVWDQYIIVRSDLGVESLEEFAEYAKENGADFGISRVGSAGHYGSAKVAEELGLVEGEDYNEVILGDLDGIRAALEQGQIDWFTWSAEGALALEDSGAAVLLGNTAELIEPTAFNVIAASRQAIEEKPASVRAFCEGYYEGQRYAKANPDEAAQLMIEEGGRDPSITPRVVEDGVGYLSDDDQMPETAFEVMAESTVFTVDGVDELTADQVRDMYTPCSEI